MGLLITGGTGTIGKEIVRQSLKQGYTGRVVLYSRDEAKHAEAAEEFKEYDNIRYITGDICDYEKLLCAMDGIDTVIHAAAMKRIDTCEYDPIESTRVNIFGSMNVAKAARASGVNSAMLISTDKACNPCSVYGAQKYASERLWIGMNNLTRETRFNVVRYGNVNGSRGSVVEKWFKASSNNDAINVTDENMTRFFWEKEEAADFIINMMSDSNIWYERGCIYVPKMKSSNMLKLAMTFSNNINITGLRCPEKIHEEMVSEVEAMNTYEVDDHYIIYPSSHEWCKDISPRGERVPEGFVLCSKKER